MQYAFKNLSPKQAEFACREANCIRLIAPKSDNKCATLWQVGLEVQ